VWKPPLEAFLLHLRQELDRRELRLDLAAQQAEVDALADMLPHC
jgi:hypothetical protein